MDNLSSKKKIDILKSVLLNFNSKNDTKKLAILLIIPKLISSSEIPEDELQAIYDEVGFRFLNRLLRSKQVLENCSEYSFKVVSLGILKSFSCIQALAEDKNMLKNIPVFNKILVEVMTNKSSNEEETKLLITDCLETMLNISKTQNGCKSLIHDETVSAVGECIENLSYGWDKAFDLLKIMLKHPNFTSSKMNREKFPDIMSTITLKVFSNPPMYEVFEVLRHLVDILDCFDEELLSAINLRVFWPVLIEGLHGMLRSKLNLDGRQLAVSASCKVVSLLGVGHFLTDKTLGEFFYLSFHLCSVELQVSLDVTQDQMDPIKLQLYMTCCKIVELSIQYCGSVGQDVEDAKVNRLKELIFELMSAILQFFRKFSTGTVEEDEVTPYCRMLLRLVCAFISFQEFALDENILDLMPSFVNVYNALFKKPLEKEAVILSGTDGCKCRFQTSSKRLQLLTTAVCRASLDDKPYLERGSGDNNEEMTDSPLSIASGESDLHLLDLFLPGLESLSHLNEAREVVLESDALEMLLHYFSFLCRRVTTGDDEDLNNRVTSLNSLCDIFCNFVYPDEELCEEYCFREVCITLLHILTNPDFKFLSEDLDLILSLQTVCVILLRKTYVHTDLDENCVKQFGQNVVSILKKVASSSSKYDPSCKKLLKKELKRCLLEKPHFRGVLEC